MLEMQETFETRKNIKRFRRFKPQAFQASSFKTDPDFHQDDDSRAVIPDLIRNRCYCQKTVDPDFRQDDAFVRACPEFNSGMTLSSE